MGPFSILITKVIVPLLIFFGASWWMVGLGVDPTVASIIAGAAAFGEIVVTLKMGL